MRYKRHLPHWLPEGAVLHVSWRLAESWPAPKPEVLERKYSVSTGPSGPRWLADARIAQTVAGALHFGAEERKLYELFAWVVMPNHVHILIEPYLELPAVMRWLKGRTARVANRILGRTNQPFWCEESYDHIIRSAEEFRNTAYYIEANPVRAGFVASPDDWRFSNAFDRPRKTTAGRTRGLNGC